MTTTLLNLLEHDLHRASKGTSATPLLIETPAKSNFVPAIVSTNTPGRFLVARKLKSDSDGTRIRSAVFKHDPDRVDDLLQPLLKAAYDLSVLDDFPNRFSTPDKAFEYIADNAGTGAHPHVLLVPQDWSVDRMKKSLGDLKESKSGSFIYRDFCRVINSNVDIPVFFSRPDYVGMYTQFLGGSASIFLHNVRNGLAFVTPKPHARRKIS